MKVVINDGGRKTAGFPFSMKLCLVRAVAIATERPYQEVLTAIGEECSLKNPERLHAFMASLGWSYTALETPVTRKRWIAPAGRLVVVVNTHHVAVVDGVNHDVVHNYAEGETLVKGYWKCE
jgi:hypothetical protein